MLHFIPLRLTYLAYASPLRNVYRKLGVHSRQEPIDLLDAAGSAPVEQVRANQV